MWDFNNRGGGSRYPVDLASPCRAVTRGAACRLTAADLLELGTPRHGLVALWEVEALRDRAGPSTGRELTAESRFSDAAAVWLAEVQESARLGTVVPNTPVLYEGHLRNHVLPALGELRLREVTTFRVDALLGTLRKRLSAASVKSIRSVVSGVLGTAVRHGAITSNPTREVRRIQGGTRRKPRALTPQECSRWLASWKRMNGRSAETCPT